MNGGVDRERRWVDRADPSMTSPRSSTSKRSETQIRVNDTANGLIQKRVGSSGSRAVRCPAIPSSRPMLPRIRKAAARRCLRCWRSSLMVVQLDQVNVVTVSDPVIH